MKTTDLGLPENLEKLNYVVGKISGLIVFLNGGVVLEETYDDYNAFQTRYSPCTNAKQCLEATPKCHVCFDGCINSDEGIFSVKIENNKDIFRWMESDSELIARCLALAYSVHGNDVPDSVFEA